MTKREIYHFAPPPFQGHSGKSSSLNGFKPEIPGTSVDVDQGGDNNNDINGEKFSDVDDNDDDDDDGYHRERRKFRQTAGRASPPRSSSPPHFASFSFPGSDEPRHFKDRALNLAMEFNGERGRRGLQARPISPMLGAPKSDDCEDRRPPTPSNNDSAPNEERSQGSMAASVQAALAALQAGQISLNQVSMKLLFQTNYVL